MKTTTNTPRFQAAVQLASAWAVARGQKSRAPSVGEILDTLESFHEQLSSFDVEAHIAVRPDKKQH